MEEDKENCDDKKANFDYLLTSELGEFGKFQIITIILVAVPAMFAGFMAGDYIFTAARLPHRCAIPECDDSVPEFLPTWISYAVPLDGSGNPDSCSRYENTTLTSDNKNSGILADDICPASLFNRNSIIACEEYVYERTNSVVFDFGLECREWLRALAGTLNSLGGMAGLPFAGYMSDRWGRRVSVLFFSFSMATAGLIRSFSVNYGMYVVFQFLQTAIGGGVFSAAYVLATEFVGLRYRVRTSAIMSSMFALGQALLGLIASAVYEWRILSIVLHAPMFLLLTYYWILPESPRWLLSKNMNNRAKKIINKMAKINKRAPSSALIVSLVNEPSNRNTTEQNSSKESTLFLQIIRSPILLRRCFVTPVWWVTTTFVYYGLSINSVNLSGNMYFNYVATVLIEIPGYWAAVLLLDRIGRRITLFSAYILNAACCLAFAFVPDDYPVLSLVLYLIGKFSIALVFTSVYLYTSELYPTKHRHSLLAFSSTIGRIGSVLAPLTPPLMDFWTGIPSTMFGAMALLSGILVLTQPETLGVKLPDTIEEAESIGK